jgi:hypothetical protein
MNLDHNTTYCSSSFSFSFLVVCILYIYFDIMSLQEAGCVIDINIFSLLKNNLLPMEISRREESTFVHGIKFANNLS